MNRRPSSKLGTSRPGSPARRPTSARRSASHRPSTRMASRTTNGRPPVSRSSSPSRTPRSTSALRTTRNSHAPASRTPSAPKPVTRAVKRATNAAMREKEALEGPKSEWPMRINKYLAQKGYATRKAADELINKRRVLINGRPAVLGDKVEETDNVEVRIDKTKPQKQLVYFAFNKPHSVMTHSAAANTKKPRSGASATSDLNGDRDILNLVPELEEEFGVFPIGRLDKDSHGLIILTNDGRVTDRLLSPTRDHEKEYLVQVKLKLRESFKTHMEEGVNIEGYQTRPAKVRLTGANSFSIIITEGKKHQIRRMVVALFNEVRDLERVRILNIELGKLCSGKYRTIEGEELAMFLKSLGL